MALGPRLDLRQSQSLVMTPQLQQAIKLLALSNLELEAYLAEALEGNPLLDATPGDREPGDDELSAEVQLPEHKVRRLRTAAMRPASLDEPAGDDDSKTVAELVADDAAVMPENAEDCELAMNALSEALTQLDAREQRVLKARFGLCGCEARTLEDLGSEIGVTREYVRQIQNRALSKMRRKISALGVSSV